MGKDKILRGQNKKDGIVESDFAPSLRASGGTDIRKRPVVKVKSNTKKGFEEAKEGDTINLLMPKSKTRRGRVGVAQTLDTQVNQATITEGNIRRLTEIECERLQGFPDDWTKYGDFDVVTKEISRTQRYKLVGNAVTVYVVELIGLKLLPPAIIKTKNKQQ